MNEISNRIYNYYFEHIDTLDTETQFHFATRLYLWSGDTAAWQLLQRLRPWCTADEQPGAAVRQVLEHVTAAPLLKVRNATALRTPYFERYPLLRQCNVVLFRLLFLKTIYDIDERTLFYELFDKTEVEAMYTALKADSDALRILATYATNFLYIYARFIHEDETGLPIRHFYELGSLGYDGFGKTGLQLNIYFYTHCIIGESLFYSRALPQETLPVYVAMSEYLEGLIAANYADINLDNKFEFLVASLLCGYRPGLSGRIYEEANRSLADEGDFLVDRYNSFPQPDRQSFAASEHRNVLFLLSCIVR